MVAKKAVPPEHHVMRFVPANRQHRHPDTDEFLGLLPSAMELTKRDEGGLSVTWIEFYGPLGFQSKQTGAAAFRESLESKRVGAKGVFASGNVGEVLSAGERFGKTVRVVHVHEVENPGHAEVRHFTDEDVALLDVLATEVFCTFDFVADLKLPK